MSRSPNERLVAAITMEGNGFHIPMLAEPEESGQCRSFDQGGNRVGISPAIHAIKAEAAQYSTDATKQKLRPQTQLEDGR